MHFPQFQKGIIYLCSKFLDFSTNALDGAWLAKPEWRE